VINKITSISVIGIAVITAALIILLSAFNGIEKMIEQLYSDFDTDITIVPAEGKTFQAAAIDTVLIQQVKGVKRISQAIDEIVVLKHEQKWVNARMIGVQSSFLEMAHMNEHIVDGEGFLKKGDADFALIGATLLDKLGGFIPEKVGYETIQIYAPKRDAKMRLGSNPFTIRLVNVSGRMNYNREVNAEKILVPIELASEALNYGDDISALFVETEKTFNVAHVKANLQEILGDSFLVRTNYEKNELIYKTSRSEKMIVIIILVFIFILAAFNLIASITMLFVEKKDNLRTLAAIGASEKSLFQIFFLEGLLISGKGILSGFVLGYAVCFLQLSQGWLVMPNSGGEAFPIALNVSDGLMILFLVSALSLIFSYFPVRILMKRHKEERP
jgi:lipoprotein-releasing system permease protein